MKRITVYKHRYLYYNDAPYFPVVDTAWNLFFRLSTEDAEFYLQRRREQGFSVIMVSLICEADQFTTGNCYGELPFTEYDNNTVIPNERYFAHVDRLLEFAERNHIFLGLLPCWGDKFNRKWGGGPELFTPQNATVYAEFLAKRYRNRENIIWILGGDRPLETERHRGVIDAFGSTFKRLDGNHLIGFHPCSGKISADYLRHSGYLDFQMAQSGHGVETCYHSAQLLARAAGEQMPFLDGESRYECHPACWRPDFNYLWNAHDVRSNNYFNVLQGACGIVYGNQNVWDFTAAPSPMHPLNWKCALDSDAVWEIMLLRDLRLFYPFEELRPDAAFSEPLYPTCAINGSIACARGQAYAFVYSPIGLPFTVHCGGFGGKTVRAEWFNVKTGERKTDGIYPCENIVFAPERQGGKNDALLILELLE